MNKFLKAITFFVIAGFVMSGVGYTEVRDFAVIPIGPIDIAEIADLTVNIRNRTGDAIAGSVIFPAPGTTTWTIADQYVQVVYNCNLSLYAIRIVSDNNNAASPYFGLAAKPLVWGPDADWDTLDDGVSYGGLINAATMTNPDNRAILAWQVFQSKVVPTALTDESLYGKDPATGIPSSTLDNWNADWATVVDRSNRWPVSAAEADSDGPGGLTETLAGAAAPLARIGVNQDNNYNTVTYSSIVQGGAGGSGLNYHPAGYVGGVLQPKPGESGGDGINPADGVVVYLGARFGGISAGSYGINDLRVELIYNE